MTGCSPKDRGSRLSTTRAERSSRRVAYPPPDHLQGTFNTRDRLRAIAAEAAPTIRGSALWQHQFSDGAGRWELSNAFLIRHCSSAATSSRKRSWPSLSIASVRPPRSTKRSRLCTAMRSPGTMIPARFRGSPAPIETSSLDSGARRRRRNAPTASGSANCSPLKPATKRPPRTSPRASRRRYTPSSSRQLGMFCSRCSTLRNTTP